MSTKQPSGNPGELGALLDELEALLRDWPKEDAVHVRPHELRRLIAIARAAQDAKVDFERIAAGVIHPHGAAKMGAESLRRALEGKEPSE